MELLLPDLAFCGAVGFLWGILFDSFGWSVLLVGLVGIFIPRKNLGMFALVFIGMLLCGSWYYSFFLSVQRSKTHLPTGKSVVFSAIVSDEPTRSAKSWILEAALQKPHAGMVTIFAPVNSPFLYGDEIKVSGEIQPPENPGDDPSVFPKTISLLAHNKGFWLRAHLINFKLAFIGKLGEMLSPDQAALLGGETLGDTSGMSPELKAEMSASGTSYVAAMYGYKIAIAILALEAVLRRFFAHRVRFFALAGFAVLFALMAGGNASAVRAAIMAIIALAAIELGRAFNPRNMLAFTAVGMAIWDPTVVVGAAFELSFLSIVGIMYLVGPLKKFFSWENSGTGILEWREGIVLAIATLLAIVPVVDAAFGDFSLTAFPSNILIFPAVAPAMITGLALVVVGFVIPPAAFLFAKIASIFLLYQLAIIKIFSDFTIPLSFAFNAPISFLLYYSAIGGFAYYYREK